MPRSASKLATREPVQQRSILTWQRILDASVEVICESGMDGCTIAMVCERAGVAPTAIYSRVNGRDGLLLAAYEHGIAPVVDAEAGLVALASKPDTAEAVRRLADSFEASPEFLRAVILGATKNALVASRGREVLARTRERFVAACVGKRPSKARRAAAEMAFGLAFSSLVVTLAYGPEFVGMSDYASQVESLAAHLSELVH